MPSNAQHVSRRAMLLQLGSGFGGLACAPVRSIRSFGRRTARRRRADAARLNGGLHHPARETRGATVHERRREPHGHVRLQAPPGRIAGQTFDPGGNVKLESVTGSPGFKVLKSPFEFKQYGQCGRWVSSVFPHLATCVDDLAFLTSMASKTNVHGPASYMQNTGFVLPGFPCMGAWIGYGLGSLDGQPAHVRRAARPRGLPYNNQGNFSAGFLPVKHQGTIIRPNLPNPIADLFPPRPRPTSRPTASARDTRCLARRTARTSSSGPATRGSKRGSLPTSLPRGCSSRAEALDVASETAETERLYGLDEKPTEVFGRNCLVARRLLERGVRFVQVWSGAAGPSNNWDNHGNISAELPPIALATDKPCAALVKDLKARGMFEDTLIVWTTEFGRMPFSQGTAGRDHNAGTFVSWLAGAGIRGGVAHGQSDEWGWQCSTPTWCYDLHATILHLMGIDHTRLTVRFNGANRRLTDVHGHVIPEILA